MESIDGGNPGFLQPEHQLKIFCAFSGHPRIASVSPNNPQINAEYEIDFFI